MPLAILVALEAKATLVPKESRETQERGGPKVPEVRLVPPDLLVLPAAPVTLETTETLVAMDVTDWVEQEENRCIATSRKQVM